MSENECNSRDYKRHQRSQREEVKRLLEEQEIDDIDDLIREIERTRLDVQEAQQKKKVKRLEEAKNRLENLTRIKEMYEKNEISKPSEADNDEKLKLEEELKNGLAKNELDDIDELKNEINKTQNLLKESKEKGHQKKIFRYESELNELEKLMQIYNQLHCDKFEKSGCSLHINDRGINDLNTSSTSRIEFENTLNSSKEIEYLRTIADELPKCAEKIIIQLLLFFKQHSDATQDDIAAVEQLKSELNSLLNEQQFIRDSLIEEEYRNLGRYFDSCKRSLIIKSLEKMLQAIRPLNVVDIEKLISKANEAGTTIKDKDITLLIGETGVGKSTTIHFLAGSTMENVRVQVEDGEYLEHIRPTVPKNRQLQEVTTSPLSKSETRFLKTITIPVGDISGSEEIILCDTPGFGDTAGPEVDIANNVGVIRALKGCKSVKILVLSSYKGLGDRGQGIRKLAYLLVKMIPDISERVHAISYAYTKYPETTKISGLLTDIKKNAGTAEKDDKLFVTILNDMIKKSKNEATKINPLKQNPQELIEIICNLEGIEYPNEAFKFSLNQDTQSYIDRQIERDKSNIKNAFETGNNELVIHYLKNLDKLNSITQQDVVKDAYNDSMRYLAEESNSKNKISTEMFNRAMQHKNGLQKDEIRVYKEAIELSKSFDLFKKEQKQINNVSFPSSDALIENVFNEINKTKDCIEAESISSKDIKYYFKNLLTLKQNFQEFEERLNEDFERFLKRLVIHSNKTKELVNQINGEDFNGDSFKILSDNIFELYNCTVEIDEYFFKKIQAIFQDVLNHLFNCLETLLSKALNILDKSTLDDFELKELKKILKILDYVKHGQTVLYYTKIPDNKQFEATNTNVKDPSHIYKELIERILRYFNDKIEIINEELRNEKFESIHKLVKDLDNIRELPEIGVIIEAKYCNTIEKIQKSMSGLQKEAEKLLQGIDVDNCDFRLLAKKMRRLEINGKWLENIRPGSYEEMIYQIKEDILNNAMKLQENLLGLDFSLRNPTKLNDANQIIKKIKSMSFLVSYIPELQNHINDISNSFIKRIQDSFDTIQNSFNLQENESYEHKKTLAELEKTKSKLFEYHSCNVFLKEKNHQNIEELEDCIKKLEKDIEESKNKKTIQENSLNDQIKDISKKIEAYYEAKRKSEEDANTYLKSIEFDTLEDLEDAKIKTKNKLKDLCEPFSFQIIENEDLLNNLKSVEQQYKTILSENQMNENQIKYLKAKGLKSSGDLQSKIENLEKSIAMVDKTKKTHYFPDRLNADLAETALEYVEHCEKVILNDVKKIASETNELLKEFISVYANNLETDITNKLAFARGFLDAIKPDDYKKDNFYDKIGSLYDLNFTFREFVSFQKFPKIFIIVNGEKNLEFWQQECISIYSNVKDEILNNNRSRYFIVILDIARALSFIDRIFPTIFSENGFEKLYTTHRIELNKESKAIYKTILQLISNADFANADIQIGLIEESPINQTDEVQIKYDLDNCLKKLMRETYHTVNWLEGKIERQDNNDKIQLITETIEKLRTAQSKKRIVNYIENEKTKQELEGFETKITNKLSDVVLKGYESISHLIKTKNFFEAEKGIENISNVQKQLIGYLSNKVDDESNRLRKELDKNIEEIIEKSFDNIDDFRTNSPKDLLLKLKAVSWNKKYEHAYESVLSRIKQALNKWFDDLVKKDTADEKLKLIGSVKLLNFFLPEDLGAMFSTQLNDFKSEIEATVGNHKIKMTEQLKLMDDGQINVDDMVQFTKDCDAKHITHEMEKQIRIRLKKSSNSAEQYLKENKLKEALDILLNLEKFNYAFPKSGDIYIELKKTLVTNYRNKCEILLKLVAFDNNSEISFKQIIDYHKFNKENPKIKLLSEKHNEKVVKIIQNLHSTFLDVQKSFDGVIQTQNITELKHCLTKSKESDLILQVILQTKLNELFLRKIEFENILTYEKKIESIKKMITEMSNNIDENWDIDDSVLNESKRKAFFEDIQKSKEFLINVQDKLSDILEADKIDVKQYLNKFDSNVKSKLQSILTKMKTFASKTETNFRECDKFRVNYLYFKTSQNYLKYPDLNKEFEDVEQTIYERVYAFKKRALQEIKEAKIVAENLVAIKFLSENLIVFKENMNKEIDEVLNNFKEKNPDTSLVKLCMILETSDVGSRLISEHSTLSGQDWRRRREKMQNQDNLEYVLDILKKCENVDTDAIKSRYVNFKEKYDKLLASTLTSFKEEKEAKEPNLESIISEIKNMVGSCMQNGELKWTSQIKDMIPRLLAHIFVVWTCKNTQHYNRERGINAGKEYLLMPHVAQVCSIFRIFGIGYSNSQSNIIDNTIKLVHNVVSSSRPLANNLVEVGTGEGKSVILAITACVFALLGVDVNCSCYSEYLCRRDRYDFNSLFSALGIEKKIKYGTFNELCEQFLNEKCNVRENVREMIENNKTQASIISSKTQTAPKVLLIDEVDVFLSDRFYGAIYSPSFILNSSTVISLLDAIWNLNKNQKIIFNQIKGLPEYAQCVQIYSNWQFLIYEALKDIFSSLVMFKPDTQTYIVKDDVICYTEGDSLVKNLVHGYNTIWAYYYEHERKKISKKSLKENVGIIINCGIFSYAEIPKEFSYITGVSGTLKSLTDTENGILKNTYKIESKTFMPSVFGICNRKFNPNSDTIVVEESEYYMKIRNEIDAMKNANRCILVFFETYEKLQNFYDSKELSDIKNDVQLITEHLDANDRELHIKRACTIGKVTLLTRAFGRGTDFICRNTQILANGGVHVLQTFFSSELSEEYQIMGRCARQGDTGSYRMVLLDKGTELFIGPDYKEQLKKMKGDLYKTLDKLRNRKYESLCAAKLVGIDESKKKHEASNEFMRALCEGNMVKIKDFLLEQNKGILSLNNTTRTLLLIDATGSMSSLLSAVKETVCTMYERATIVLNEKGIKNECFLMQIAVYRNYNSKEESILKASSWESKGNNLKHFLSQIDVEGGLGKEAIEIGLWHAVQESQSELGISQVILIGDAPANAKNDVTLKRNFFGEKYWKRTKFCNPTFYEEEMEKLKQKGIPIHCFYLTQFAKSNFEEIACFTGGRCEELNIHAKNGVDVLTNLVTEEVLRKAAGNEGEAAVKLYREKFCKTYK